MPPFLLRIHHFKISTLAVTSSPTTIDTIAENKITVVKYRTFSSP